MKSVFKCITLLLLFQSTSYAEQEAMILFSGKPSPEYMDSLKKSLNHVIPNWNEMVRFDEENEKCEMNKKVVIQFCLRGDELNIVHQHKKTLTRSLARLVTIED